MFILGISTKSSSNIKRNNAHYREPHDYNFQTKLKLVSNIFPFFHQMAALKKLWKILFASSKNFFSFARYSDVCIHSPHLIDKVLNSQCMQETLENKAFWEKLSKNLLGNMGNMGYDLGLFQKLHLLIYASRIYGIIIIPVSSDPLNMKTVEGKQKIQKHKYLDKEKRFLGNIKSAYHDFWNAFGEMKMCLRF